MDIIHSSVMKYDIATTRVGLEAVTDRVIKIIDSDGQEEISRYFCDHLERVGELTVSKLDEKLTSIIIGNLYNFGVFAAESGFEYAAMQAVYSLKHIGKATAKHGLKNAAKQAAKSLECVGTTAADAERGCEVVTEQTIQSLGHIGKAAATKRIKRASNQAVESLRVVGIFAAKNKLNR
jgi:predicted transcriptional regulator YheO